MQNAAGCCQEHLTGRLDSWSRASPSMSSRQVQTLWALPFSIKLGPRLVTIFPIFFSNLWNLNYIKVPSPSLRHIKRIQFQDLY